MRLLKDPLAVPTYLKPALETARGQANKGLIFSRIVGRWENPQAKNNEPPPTNAPKLRVDDAMMRVSGAAGDPGMIKHMDERVLALVAARGGLTWEFDLQGRFATGLGLQHPTENGLAFHLTLGTPYLPGSGVKGMTQAFAYRWALADDPQAHKEAMRRIFGRDPGADADPDALSVEAGAVVFLDALPTSPPTLAADGLTPHLRSWIAKGADLDDRRARPNPVTFLSVSSARFRFSVLPRARCAPSDLELAWSWLGSALVTIGAGAKTKTGYGRFHAVEVDQGARTTS